MRRRKAVFFLEKLSVFARQNIYRQCPDRTVFSEALNESEDLFFAFIGNHNSDGNESQRRWLLKKNVGLTLYKCYTNILSLLVFYCIIKIDHR